MHVLASSFGIKGYQFYKLPSMTLIAQFCYFGLSLVILSFPFFVNDQRGKGGGGRTIDEEVPKLESLQMYKSSVTFYTNFTNTHFLLFFITNCIYYQSNAKPKYARAFSKP